MVGCGRNESADHPSGSASHICPGQEVIFDELTKKENTHERPGMSARPPFYFYAD
jgi:hypothetical protein